MKRSLYPDGVEVGEDDLDRTEESKSEEIRVRNRDTQQLVRDGVLLHPGGIVNGLRVTVNNVDNTLLNVSAGSAYTPNGERVVVPTDQSGLSLADYTDEAANLICLFYKESQTTPKPHITDGTARNTEATPTFELIALTEATFDALSASLDTDLSTRAKDRAVIIARVSGNGPGNAIQSAEILQQAAPVDIVGAYYSSGQLPGINIGALTLASGLAQDDSITDAALQLTVTNQATKTLSFNDGGGYGASTNVATTNGSVTLTAASGSELTVDVRASLLSTEPGTYSEDLTLTRQYDKLGASYSPADETHRQRGDTTRATERNPHGMQLSDLIGLFAGIGGSVDLGRDLFTSDNLLRIARILIATSSNSGEKTLLFENDPDNGSRRIRAYIDGDTATLQVTVNARWNGTDYEADDTGTAYSVAFGATDNILTFGEQENTNWPSGSFTFDDPIARVGVQNGTIQIKEDLELGGDRIATNAERDEPRITFATPDPDVVGNNKKILLMQIGPYSADEAGTRLYYSVGGSNQLEILHNCYWVNAAEEFRADKNGAAYMVMIGRRDDAAGPFSVYRRDAVVGTGWTTNSAGNPSNTQWPDIPLLLRDNPGDNEGFVNVDGFFDTAERDHARLALHASSAERTCVLNFPLPSSNSETRIYRCGSSGISNSTAFEIALNAKYSNTANNWEAPATGTSWLLHFSESQISLFRRASSSAGDTWSDAGNGGSNWSRMFNVDDTSDIITLDKDVVIDDHLFTGDVTASGSVFSTEFRYQNARTFHYQIPLTAGLGTRDLITNIQVGDENVPDLAPQGWHVGEDSQIQLQNNPQSHGYMIRVNLPDGANMRNLRVIAGSFGVGGAALSCRLHRASASGSNIVLAGNSGITSRSAYSVLIDDDFNTTVNNELYTYYLHIGGSEQGLLVNTGLRMSILQARIEYRMLEAI